LRGSERTSPKVRLRPARVALPPLRPRKERNPAESRRRILDAAEMELAAKGFDGARLSSIARAAGVQQALIHHYFEDKERLHRAVLERALDSMTAGVWQLVERMQKDLSTSDLREIAEGFVDVLLHFYATHGVVLQIVRHDSLRGDSSPMNLVGQHLRPIFEAIVSRLETMKARGECRADLDPRQLCMCAVGMAAFPFQEERFYRAIWDADLRSERFLRGLKNEIVSMVLARVLP
jgi:TetR/AcrR family transcriptional regulator